MEAEVLLFDQLLLIKVFLLVKKLYLTPLFTAFQKQWIPAFAGMTLNSLIKPCTNSSEKYMFFRIILLIVFLMTLPGCLAYKKIYPEANYTFNQNSKAGLVVMSLDISGHLDIPFFLSYRLQGQTSWVASAIPLLGQYVEGESAFLHVFELPPGQYEFNSLYIEEGYQQASWGAGGKYSIPFSVVAGKVNYIGRIHIHSTDIGNSDFFIESQSSRTDEYQDDISLFSKYYSTVDMSNSQVLNNIDLKQNGPIVREHLGSEYKVRP